MFGQFTGQKQPDGGLDLAGADGRFLVVVGKVGSFGGDALEDVDSIAFLSLSPSLLLDQLAF